MDTAQAGGAGLPASGQTQAEARALGDRTRNTIFRHIAGAGGPVSVAELTALVRLNHNAVRQHLAVLKEAGLVVEAHEHRTQPGRPRLLYRVNPAVRGSWGTSGPYELLATLLSEVLLTGNSPYDVGLRAGRRRARQLRRDAGPLAAIEEDLETGGFEPTAAPIPEGREFTLGRCPFEAVAADDPGTVCQLHQGMVDGLAATLGHGVSVALSPNDPHHAGCRLRARAPVGAPTHRRSTPAKEHGG